MNDQQTDPDHALLMSPDEADAIVAAHRLATATTTAFPVTDPLVAHEYLRDHPIRGHMDTSFLDTLWFAYVKVDPSTDRIEDDQTRNTETQVWIETGPGLTEPTDMIGAVGTHDYDLDCGGPTFDATLVALANLVHDVYGDSASRARPAR